MSDYLIRHLASGTSTIITGTPPLSLDAPQGAGVYEVYALSAPSQVTVAAAQAATVPTAFGVGDWSLDDSPSVGGDTLTLTVAALPADGGSPITAIHRRIGAGAEQTLLGTGLGARQITVLAETEASIELRAVNAIGSGPWSTAKAATPTTLAGNGTAQSGSVRFPDTNGHTEDTNLVLRQSTTNMPAPLGVDTAFFGIVQVPFVTRNEEEIYTILGDGFGGSNFTVALYGRGANLGDKANRVVCIANDDIVSADLGAVERFLWVAERQGNNVRVGIYPCDGSTSLPGSFKAAVAGGANTWAGSEFRIGDFGADGTVPDDTLLGVNKVRRFPGEMACMGYVSGTVAQADWERIAAGADPVSTLGAPNLPWYRNFDGTSATLSAPAEATADATSAMTVFGSLAMGGDIVAQSEALSLMVDPLPFPGQIFGVKKADSYATAQIPLSGTATGRDGETIEVRIRYESGDAVLLDWATVGTVSGGAWSGTVTCPRSANGWCYVEVRSTSEPDAVATRMQPFAAGYKLLALGQSQFTIALGNAGVGTAMVDPLSVTYVNTLYAAPTPLPLRAARIGGDWQSDFMANLSNTLRAYGDTTPMMVIRETVNGSTVQSLLDDGTQTRTFQSLVQSMADVGSDVSVVIHQWGTSDAGYQGNYGELHDALTVDADPLRWDHNLNDALDDGYEYLVMPLTRHNNSGATERVRQESIEWAEANSRPIGPFVSDMEIDEGLGSLGAHQNVAKLMGNPNFGAKTGIGLARALGLDMSENPYFSDEITLSADRKTLTVQPVLPNGGTLYSPTPTNLTQFYVSEDGGATTNRDGFTAQLVGGTVEITKDDNSDWALGSIVSGASDNRPYEPGVWSEADIVAGTIYETYDKDVIGRGLMVLGGRNSDGTINTRWASNPAALLGVAGPSAGLPTGGEYRGTGLLKDNPYLFSNAVANTVNPVPWIVPPSAGHNTLWIAATMFHRIGNQRPFPPEVFQVRKSGSPFTNMRLFGTDSAVFGDEGGANRALLTLQYLKPVTGADTIYNDYNTEAYMGLNLWELDETAFDVSAALSANAVNLGGNQVSVEFSGVPAGSAVFALAYNRDGAPIVWNGGTVNFTDTSAYSGGQDRTMSALSGTAAGNTVVTASAEILVVAVIPPR